MKTMMRLTAKQRKNLTRIAVSGALLLVLEVLCLAKVIPDDWRLRLPLFLIPYLLVGYDVLRKAVLGIAHAQLLDENFLMTIATIGAVVIGEYPEAVFVMLFYQVGELFQSIAVGRSRRSIADLMNICPEEARVERDGEETVVSPDEVSVGETLVIRPGEKIPLDGVVTDGSSEINTASLTGESAPRAVTVGDEVVSGCVNGTGLIRVRVTKPFGESTVSKILELVENSSVVKSRTENAVTKFARIYTPAVVGIALLLAVIPTLITHDVRWIYSALIFLVVSCPCALVISVPLTYFAGIGRASRRGILIKGANYLEALAAVDTIAFDKTGTLTQGVFRVSGVYPADGMTAEQLLALCAAAEKNSNHPIAASIVEAAGETAEAISIESVEELAGMGVRALADGRTVLVGNARLLKANGIELPTDERLQVSVGTVVFVAVDGVYAGCVTISDACKPDSADAIGALRASGVRRLVMLSGDRDAVAASVSAELGLTEYRAELLPADKVKAVEDLLAEKRGTLVFVGDGTNDAPVLARSDVGIAMGAFGSDAAIEAADVVLMDDKPSKIPHLLRIAKRTRRIVWENILFALAVKIGFLILNVFVPNMWAATFADVGVAVIAILNASRAGR